MCVCVSLKYNFKFIAQLIVDLYCDKIALNQIKKANYFSYFK